MSNGPTGGFIKLHRSLKNNEVYNNEPLFALWVKILLSVMHKEYQLDSGITLQPGQCVMCQKRWAEAAKVPSSTIKRRLEKLEKMQMIRKENATRTQRERNENATRLLLITVCNWETYNGNGSSDATRTQRERNENATRTQTEEERRRKKEEGRKKKDTPPAGKTASDPDSIEEARARAKEEVGKYRGNYPEDDRDRFDQFWAAYPRRKGKKVGRKEKSMELFCGEDAGTQKLIIETLENFKQLLGKEYPVDPTTYLGPQKIWKENLDKPDVEEPEEFVQQVCYSEEQYLEALKDPANRPFISSKDRNRYD